MKLLRLICAFALCLTGVALQAKPEQAKPENIIHLKDKRKSIIAEAGKYDFVIVKYSAPWCGPCKTLAPIIERLAREFPNITIIEIDVDDYPAPSYIRHIPTLEFYVKGQKVATVGNQSEQGMRNLIKQHFKPVCATPSKK